MPTQFELETQKKQMKDLNKKCQKALAEVLKGTGYHVRIIFYPGEADKD